MSPISLLQALRNAVEAERASAVFYRELIPLARDDKTTDLLDELARDEDAHAERLIELADSLVVDPLPAAATELAEIVEAPPPLSSRAGISYVKALYVALEAEHHATHFYDLVAEETSGEVSELFRTLAQFERRHAERLERLLADATSP